MGDRFEEALGDQVVARGVGMDVVAEQRGQARLVLEGLVEVDHERALRRRHGLQLDVGRVHPVVAPLRGERRVGRNDRGQEGQRAPARAMRTIARRLGTVWHCGVMSWQGGSFQSLVP